MLDMYTSIICTRKKRYRYYKLGTKQNYYLSNLKIKIPVSVN